MLHDDKPSLAELAHFGVKGMRWGHRKSTPSVGQQRRAMEKKTGEKYRRDTFEATKNSPTGPIRRTYTDKQIKEARKYQAGLQDHIKNLDKQYGKNPETGKLYFSKEHEKAYAKLLDSDQRVIAKYKTRGEKTVAILIAGPIGAYATSNFRVMERVVNQRA